MALAVIDSLFFSGNAPSVVKVAPTIYAIAFKRGLTRQWLITVSIDAGGNIGDSLIDSFNYYTGAANNPALIHVSGNIYTIAYEDASGHGQLITVGIDSAGNITEPIIDILQFYTFTIGFKGVLTPYIIHISGDIYAIAYCDWPGTPNYGWVKTVDIDSAGNIGAVVGSHRFEDNYCRDPYIEAIYGTVYALVYDAGNKGWVKTITIENDGTISASPIIDTLNFALPLIYGFTPSMVHVSGDVYAIVYGGTGSVGFLRTLDIAADGNIGAIIDTLEFDETKGLDPYIIKLSSGLYAIAYRGADNHGFVITISIEADGTIGSIEETLEYDTSSGYWPCVFEISSDVSAIAYGDDGRIKTIGDIETPSVTTDPATDVNPTSATLNGTLNDDGGMACNCGFEWGEPIAYGNTTPTQSKTTGQEFLQVIYGPTSPAWYLVKYRYHSNEHSVYCGIPFEYQYIDGQISTMTMAESIDLSGAVAPILSFNLWSETEEYCDYLYVDVSIDGGLTWTEDIWNHTGEEAAWLPQVEIDLSGYESSQVKIRFRFVSDSSITFEGIYVDDVEVTDGATVLFSDDFESSVGKWISLFISGFSPGTTYHFRAFATNSAGTSYGADRSFTTPIDIPVVTTNPATTISAMATTLNGALDDDGGEACQCGFEWGKSVAYGSSTPTQSKNTGQLFSEIIAPLDPDTEYHFRAFAINSAGIGYGADRSFRTYPAMSRGYALSRSEL